jgi:hypothetical protein
MKKVFISLIALLACAGTLPAQTINFSILEPEVNSKLPAASAELLAKKTEQIITRNSAGAASVHNVFVIQPSIQIIDEQSSAGIVRNVKMVKGELTLTAKNKVDGSLYHTIIVSLTATVPENEDVYRKMISSIKPTDPVYTRFIRIARQKIADYYAANCAVILLKAQGLFDARQYEEALSYLSAISESLPCYEQASVLLGELTKLLPDAPDTVIIQKVIEKPVIVEKVIEKPVVIEKVVEKPVPVPREQQEPDCQINISSNDLKFKVLKCFGNATQQRVTILTEIINENTNIKGDVWTRMIAAYTGDGKECSNFGTEQNNNWWYKLPPRVPVKREYYILNLFDQVDSFSFVELKIGSVTVTIRNLPVVWE